MINVVRYNDKKSLELLASSVKDLSRQTKIVMIVEAMIVGLMTPPFLFRILRFIFSEERFRNGLLTVLLSTPDEHITDSWDAIVDHMLNGKDKTTTDAAGGWNQEELDSFMKVLTKCGVKF